MQSKIAFGFDHADLWPADIQTNIYIYRNADIHTDNTQKNIQTERYIHTVRNTDRYTYTHTQRETHMQYVHTYIHTYIHTDKTTTTQPYIQRDRETHRKHTIQTDRETDRHSAIQTYIH